MGPARLFIDEAYVGRATPMKRIRFASRGLVAPIHKPRTHLTVTIREWLPTDKPLTKAKTWRFTNVERRKRREEWKKARIKNSKESPAHYDVLSLLKSRRPPQYSSSP